MLKCFDWISSLLNLRIAELMAKCSSSLIPALPKFIGFVTLTLAGCVFMTSGCSNNNDAYPDDVVYPFRADLIVDEVPKLTHDRLPGPGQLDKAIGQIKELGGKTFSPKDLPENLRTELDTELQLTFGSPYKPSVGISTHTETIALAKSLKLDDETLAAGSKLYRRNCLHCHGLAGDGRGPTGPWVNPHPRDFRQGKFKFISSNPGGNKIKPRREDILRSLKAGVEGTSMPAFGLLGEQALEQLTSYVIHLSLRGEVEFETTRTLLKKKNSVTELFELLPDEEPAKETVQEFVKLYLKDLLKAYQKADAKGIEPASYPNFSDAEMLESVKRGYHLFSSSASDAFGCVSCHQDFGRQTLYQYDDWGTLVRPSNLTLSVYRGGRRPVDLYWRIKRGIPPSKMPAVTVPVSEESQKIWDLVNFIEALPFPGLLPDDVRSKVYGQATRGVAVLPESTK
jgi:cytochrome c2